MWICQEEKATELEEKVGMKKARLRLSDETMLILWYGRWNQYEHQEEEEEEGEEDEEEEEEEDS